MNQTRIESAIETALSTLVGFVITLALQREVYPLFGWNPPAAVNLAVAGIFTVASLARGYAMRRFCNAYLHRLAVWLASHLSRTA